MSKTLSLSSDAVLENALALACPSSEAPMVAYHPIRNRNITRRGVIWVGQTCNLRCHFCYYLDRIEDSTHPEHAFMTVEKAKRICSTLVEVYGNNAVDIQGGEPTLWPGIYDLVAHCARIGLAPTIITNAQALQKKDNVARYKEAGLRDFLVSVQGLGEVYDRVVARDGAHLRQMKAIGNLREVGVPFRFNCVLSKPVVPQLPLIAELAVRTGAQVMNFIAFNPFNDQREPGKRTAETVPTLTEIRRFLNPALDILAEAALEANVRNLPLCAVEQRHLQNAYMFQQNSYDPHETDFASWSWTDLQPQRTRDDELSPPPVMGPRVKFGPLRKPIRRLAGVPLLGPGLLGLKRTLDRAWATASNSLTTATKDEKYREDAKLRAHEHLDYRHVPDCSRCDAKDICDGFHGDYADFFGGAEARPVSVGRRITDPTHFIKRQRKVIHPETSEP